MIEVEKLKGGFQIRRFAAKRAEQIQQTLSVRVISIPGRLDIDMVGLHIKPGVTSALRLSFVPAIAAAG